MWQDEGLGISEDVLGDVLEGKMFDEREEWERMKQHLRDGNVVAAAKIFEQQSEEIDDIEFMGLILAVEEVRPEYLGEMAAHITSVSTLNKMEADLRETIVREQDQENQRIYETVLERVRTQRDGLPIEDETSL